MELPKISIDPARCPGSFGSPFECGKCLQACPRAVLALVSTVRTRRGTEVDPKNYVVMGAHLADCSGCMDCVKVCPQNAILVEFDMN